MSVEMDKVALLKKEAAEYAADLVKSGMVVGLGTGSTAKYAVMRIGERLRSGEIHDVVGIPTSKRTEALAREWGVPLTDFESAVEIDLTIDGADEVDPDFNLIKGGGGALLMEKIVAQVTRFQIIVVDQSKMVPSLGTGWAIPIEVIPFGWQSQARFLEACGAKVVLRRAADGTPFYTDHKNLILDAAFGPLDDPQRLAEQLQARVGIVEHGLFLKMTHAVVIASEDGVVYQLNQSLK